MNAETANELLEQHAKEWDGIADSAEKQGTHIVFVHQAKTYRYAAESLRMEARTGVAHCACHLIPMDKCRERSKR